MFSQLTIISSEFKQTINNIATNVVFSSLSITFLMTLPISNFTLYTVHSIMQNNIVYDHVHVLLSTAQGGHNL